MEEDLMKMMFDEHGFETVMEILTEGKKCGFKNDMILSCIKDKGVDAAAEMVGLKDKEYVKDTYYTEGDDIDWDEIGEESEWLKFQIGDQKEFEILDKGKIKHGDFGKQFQFKVMHEGKILSWTAPRTIMIYLKHKRVERGDVVGIKLKLIRVSQYQYMVEEAK